MGLNKVGLYTDKLYLQGKKVNSAAFPNIQPENYIPPVVIIGREHCFECIKEIPVNKIEEAKKAAVLMDDIAPFDGVRFFNIQIITNEKARIHYFVIKNEVFKKFSHKAFIIVPESMLIHAYMKRKNLINTKLIVNYYERNFIAYHNVDGYKAIVSQDKATEGMNQIIKHTHVLFEDELSLDNSQYSNLLMHELFKLPPFSLKQIINTQPVIEFSSSIPYKKISLLCVAFFSIYMATTSVWLYLYEQELSNQISEQREQLNDVFSLQSSFEAESEKYNLLATNTAFSKVTSTIWLTLFGLIDSGGEILTVRYENDSFTIRVKSDKSTDVIEFLSKQADITQPTMVSPVVKSRGKEIVTLNFSLTEDEK
jgi:hypothetical protein